MAETEGMSWSEIEELATKYAHRVCSAAAGKIRDDLFKETKSAIAAFYDSYRPKDGEPLYYHRHYYNFLKYPGKYDRNEKAYRKYYDNKHNDIYYGGVELTPELMDSVYGSRKHPTPNQEVVDTVFAGFHGPAGMFYTPKTFHTIPPRMKNFPRQRLLNLKKKIIDKPDKYIAYGKKVAEREMFK